MKRYYVIFEGRVQHVGFRSRCYQIAIEHGCTGYVRNMSNGMVEMQIQGEPLQIENVLLKTEKGNQFIRVDNVSRKEIALQNEKRFLIL